MSSRKFMVAALERVTQKGSETVCKIQWGRLLVAWVRLMVICQI